MSVLFADLQGFTSRSEALDVEDVDAFLAPYRSDLQAAVERTGGVVSDFAGDGMMAVFGAPVAHEDDPERAVRAAIAIRDSFLDPGSPACQADLHVRMGVTTGEVLVTLTAGHVRATGDVVNTAARLESAAGADSILVDQPTYRATGRVIDLESSNPVAAKGKSEPVLAWRVVAAKSIVPEQARIDGLSLIGREPETTLLRSVLERARTEPSTQLVSIIGEPGIGKSRLIDDLADHVHELPDLITWRVGRSLSYGDAIAFWALGEMVKNQAGILESDALAAVQEKLSASVDAVITDTADRDWVSRHLGPLVGRTQTGEGDGGRAEAFAAWRRYFEAIAEDGPTVLVFEDIHWADDALLDFIDLLADRAGGIPLLVVCTARPELLDRRPTWGGGKTNAHTLSLTPLSDADTTRLLGDLLGQALLPADVQYALATRSEGNPLYAQEYVRMLQEREVLILRDGGWAMNAIPAELPESIQGIIAARLDTLSGDEKALLQDAAVIGRTAWLAACCRLTQRSVWQADELLHSLERKQLVQRVRRSSIDGETEFVFGHALTRDVAYSQIRRADRAAKHEAAASWIRELAGERGDKASLLANHYMTALEIRRALGEPTEELSRTTRLALRDAAAAAASLGSLQVAIDLYQSALELWPSDDPARARVLLGYCQALDFAGQQDDAIFAEASAALRAADERSAAAMVEVMRSYLLVDNGDGPGSDEALERAAELLAGQPSSIEQARALAGIAVGYAFGGRSGEALALSQEALAVSEEVDDPYAIARTMIALTTAKPKGDPTITADYERAIAAARDGRLSMLAVVLYNFHQHLQRIGAIAEARTALQEAATVAREYGNRRHVFMIESSLAHMALRGGNWAIAEQRATALLDSAGEDITEWETHDLLFKRADLRLALGDFDAALEDADHHWQFGVRSGEQQFVVAGACIRGHLLAELGRTTEARDAIVSALSGIETYSAGDDGTINIALAAYRIGEPERFGANPPPSPTPWYDAAHMIARGDLSQAAERLQELEYTALEAQTRILAANKASAENNAADAHRHLARACRIFQDAGATARQRQAEAAMQRIAS